MKDFIIILLLFSLLWGGYKGMTYLNNLAQTEATESEVLEESLADNSNKRVNQSAIEEAMKKASSEVEKTNGQKAMEAVRGGTRLDIEGKPRSKEDFYKEPVQKETRPYERKEGTSTKQLTPINETDIKEQKVALEEKGKALAGEFEVKGVISKKKKTTFNIERGETEDATPPAAPQEYDQPTKKFIPSKYILVAGSYANVDNAVKEVLRLKKLGYPKTNIVLSEKNLNLISLGSFSDKAAADAEAAQIKKAGIDLYVKGMR